MKQFLPFLFLIIFLGILAFANIYLARRFNFYFSPEKTWIFYVIFPLLTLLMIFGLIPLANATSTSATTVYVLASFTMGLLLYLLMSVLLVDIGRIFTSFSPQTYGFVVLSLTLLVSIYGYFNMRDIRSTNHEVPISGLNKQIKAMHLSDLHIGHFRGKEFLSEVVEKTNLANVDVVFITGDLFDGRKHLNKESLMPLTKLKAPVYFVEGNHDRYTGVGIIKKYLRELGVNVLENEVTIWNGIQIIGLNHMRADTNSPDMHAAGNHETIQSALNKLPVDKDKPAILLHHSPDGVNYADEKGIDLYLAGHTHAGQLFPVIYIADMLFKYNRGMHQFNSTRLFVSQGTGSFGPPMRVGTNSEIALIKLTPAGEDENKKL